ncbi:AAA family ATPase [Labrenzia sp. CE80]|uniref:nSTAND1 domain-containing NTPase n=1 Tax=Labrenzia sp. CE80 TaxID=1788986 RepID=UPI00129AB783|nr:AAA family ATPase [Labrenzia sp. CE80]
MRIEVAQAPETSGANKKKGDLLQEFSREFAATRDLRIIEELRTASSEIDLHCEDPSTGETIYMECKAHRDPLSKRELTNLIGVVYGEGYTQGWLISTGPLSKDAKGYLHNWTQKPLPERAKLKVHYEDELANLLINAKLVKNPNALQLHDHTKPGHEEATWVLLVTEFGRFWTTPRFIGGVASEVYAFNASDLSIINDRALLTRLSKLDSSWAGKSFVSGLINEQTATQKKLVEEAIPVIETVEGKRWSDPRPARLKDFAGRKKELAEIFELLEDARESGSGPHVFAITGESGIGKSSLITGIRGRTRQRPFNKKYFAIAIDCRAAKSRDYINAALVRSLSKARNSGFGDDDGSEFHITNPGHPLSSPSVTNFLKSVRKNKQAICIIFDQFEEIYAKPELADVFSAAHDLFMSAVSEAGPLVLGFAWRSNFAVQQDHPAYFMWQSLVNYRQEFSLKPLETSEVNTALTTFEKELNEKLRIEARRQLVEAARGYPWHLKKLCIHLLHQVKELHKDQASVENLSVESLFSKDLQGLTDKQKSALSFIAENAPVAAYEVVEGYGEAVLSQLEDQLLVTRSGEVLNIYWDIFRDFLLNGTVPSLPLSFLPASPSIASLLSVADELRPNEKRSFEQLANRVQLAPRTVANIVRDLFIIGVASGEYSRPILSEGLSPSDPKSVVRRVRSILSKHTLLWELKSIERDGSFTETEICEALARIPSIPDYDEKNLVRHVRKLTTWFATAGFLQVTTSGWCLSDAGDVDLSYAEQRRRRSTGPFNGESSPPRALEVLKLMKQETAVDPLKTKSAGYTKAFNTLSRFGLIVKLENSWNYVAAEGDEVDAAELERLHNAAVRQPSLIEVVRLLKHDRTMTGPQLAQLIAEHFNEAWSESSLKRTGNALKRWGDWLIECEVTGKIVEPKKGVKGKPRMDTPTMMSNIKTMIDEGMSQKAIADEVGVSVASIRLWLAKDKIAHSNE